AARASGSPARARGRGPRHSRRADTTAPGRRAASGRRAPGAVCGVTHAPVAVSTFFEPGWTSRCPRPVSTRPRSSVLPLLVHLVGDPVLAEPFTLSRLRPYSSALRVPLKLLPDRVDDKGLDARVRVDAMVRQGAVNVVL